jgi:hypothetical protein
VQNANPLATWLWMLKLNGLNSISKNVLRDEDYLWLINCTTQEYLVNVGQDFHFNMSPHVWHDHQYVDKQQGRGLPNIQRVALIPC